MKPETLRLVAAALTRATEHGYTFPSLRRLSEHVSNVTGLSDRTVRRALPEFDTDPLIVHSDLPGVGQNLSQKNTALPGVGQNLSQPGTDLGQSEHITPGQSVAGRAPSRARMRARSQASTGTPPAPPPPAAPPAVLPSAVPSRYRKRTHRIVNELDGWCIMHEVRHGRPFEVPAGEGFIPVPFVKLDLELAPVHCRACWAEFDAFDADMLTPTESET